MQRARRGERLPPRMRRRTSWCFGYHGLDARRSAARVMRFDPPPHALEPQAARASTLRLAPGEQRHLLLHDRLRARGAQPPHGADRLRRRVPGATTRTRTQRDAERAAACDSSNPLINRWLRPLGAPTSTC